MSMTHSPLCPSGNEARDLPCETPCPERNRTMVLVATILASAMAFIDGTLAYIALPAIQASLHATFSDLQWVVNGYTLMLGSLLLAGGAMGDKLGRRKVFAAGIVLFAFASMACAFAPNPASLIGSRVVQGVGAALMVPQSLAIIASSFPREVRGRAIGTWAAFSALTTTIGPTIGGALIDSASWRAAFWLNVPLAILALWFTVKFVPESRSTEREPIDWPGAATATLTLGALTYFLTRWPDGRGEVPIDVVAAIAATLLGGIAFLMIERRTHAPLVPLSLFRSREFGGLNVITLLLYAALGGTLFLLPYNLIQIQHYSATQAGLALLPLGLLIGGLSRYSGRVSDRVGTKPHLIIGPLVVAAGCAGIVVPGIGGSYIDTFFVPVCVMAFGMAIVVSPLTTAVMNTVPADRTGTASGVNNAASRVAGLLAVALSGAVATAVFAGVLQSRLDAATIQGALKTQVIGHADRLAELRVPPNVGAAARTQIETAIHGAFLVAFRSAVLLNAILAAAAGLVALLLRPLAPQSEHRE